MILRISGARMLLESLKKENVDTVFGYPGGAVLPIYNVLYDFDIRHILTRHEQGAVHAADGYARVTGKPGVCIATSGPGATNLVTGLANAYMDSVPIVAFTGQVATDLIGKDSFQEADVTGITMPITKHNYLVKDVADLPKVIKEAFHIASTGRPGPVLIDLPKDISFSEGEYVYPDTVNLPGYKPTYIGHPKQIQELAKAINEAKRPVIYAGGGVITSGAHKELLALAEKADIPVTTTLMGIGCFPEDHRLSLGMLGMHGTAYANYAVTECDLLFSVGARFDDRVTGKVETFAPNAKIAHIDIDPAEIGKNKKVDIPIVGDVKNILTSLLKLVQPQKHDEWNARIDDWKRRWPLTYKESENGEIKPQYVIEQIWELTKGDAIIATEVGQNQMWAAQFYKFIKPRTFVTSGGLGTMGFGFPASIGAQIGAPDTLVFDIAGDGSIQMNIQELATAVSYNLPVKVVILDNGFLGMVRQWQEMFFNRRYSSVGLKNPDFVKLAEAYGAKGIRITKPEEVREGLIEAIEHPGPVFIDVKISPEENVLPMVPPNGDLDKMIMWGEE